MIPVDVCDRVDMLAEVREQMSRLVARGAWFEEAEDGEAFRMDVVVARFLQETVDDDSKKV